LRDLLDDKRIEAEFGSKIARLTQGVNQLNNLKEGTQVQIDSPQQAENLRRLLMAIISDVRVMLIKLCYRVERLRLLKYVAYEQRRWVAQETLDIYAPLANRLGMGLLKWELEDLAFRALEPQGYKRIAKLLEEKWVCLNGNSRTWLFARWSHRATSGSPNYWKKNAANGKLSSSSSRPVSGSYWRIRI
jgi:GTP pyrophosphokinase